MMKKIIFILLLSFVAAIAYISVIGQSSEIAVSNAAKPEEALTYFWKFARARNANGVRSVSAISPVDTIARCLADPNEPEDISDDRPRVVLIEPVATPSKVVAKADDPLVWIQKSEGVSQSTAGLASLIHVNRMDIQEMKIVNRREYGDEALIEFVFSSRWDYKIKRFVFLYRMDSGWKVVGSMSVQDEHKFEALEFAAEPPDCSQIK